jgi:hypothetical protein
MDAMVSVPLPNGSSYVVLHLYRFVTFRVTLSL